MTNSGLRTELLRGMREAAMTARATNYQGYADLLERGAAEVERLSRLVEQLEAEDALSALRYIEQRYGRLDGVGWERVLDA